MPEELCETILPSCKWAPSRKSCCAVRAFAELLSEPHQRGLKSNATKEQTKSCVAQPDLQGSRFASTEEES